MSAQAIPILTYHFTGVPRDDEDAPYTLSTEAFERQMHYLASNGYRCIAVEELPAALADAQRDAIQRVAITFDDGRGCVYREAFPILRRYGLSATVFVISSRLDRDGYLGPAQLLELKEHGISIQSHSVTHASFPTLTREQMFAEALQSRTTLESLLRQPVRYFSYPYGRYNSSARRAVRKAGYDGAVGVWQSRATRSCDVYALPRLTIRPDDTLADFVDKLCGRRDSLPPGRARGIARLLIGRARRIANMLTGRRSAE
jgi:peptidoglycan/xylan/chitin deacetylase (PgdA/CDA1 family)